MIGSPFFGMDDGRDMAFMRYCQGEKRKKAELLAPCGNYEGFLAAVNAGADAVYLGGKQFGARAYADNFSNEELIKVLYEAHLFGVKVYLTVNTLVKEEELQEFYGYLLPLYEAGLDGAIVQDMGAFCLMKRNFPGLELHASTQMTITGAYGAQFLKEQGASRIVPARELSLEEIRHIKNTVDIEIETFIHGAMCYCYSGQCLMSSMIGGRSGNRGRCAGPCRLPYTVAGKEGYYLSLKDMNTLEYLPRLIEAGIDSFKIEGRMKKPEYVAGTVSIYRKYMDLYYENRMKSDSSAGAVSGNSGCSLPGKQASGSFVVSPEDKKILSDLYIRSETGNGYYDQEKGRDMLTLEKPGYNGTDEALLASLRETYIRQLPKIQVRMRVRCKAGEPLYGEIWLGETCLCVEGPIVQEADKRAVSEEDIRLQLQKTGGTPFTVSECSVALSGDCFVPVKCLKELRRELLQKVYRLYGAREEKADREKEDGLPERRMRSEALKERQDSLSGLTVMVQTKEQFSAVFPAMDKEETEQEDSDCGQDGKQQGNPRGKLSECLVIDADLWMENESVRAALSKSRICWGLRCPVILRKKDGTWLKRLRAFIEREKPDIIYCATIDALSWVESIAYPGVIAGEASLYAWNHEAVRFWEKRLGRMSVSPELGSQEIRRLCQAVAGHRETVDKRINPEEGIVSGRHVGSDRLEITVYGRTPFMVSANCIKLSSGHCDKDRMRYTEISDRSGRVFPVYTNCSHCYNIIYNALPTGYQDDLWKFLEDGIRHFRMEFTVENGRQTAQIYQTFRRLVASEINRKKALKILIETTAGRLHKGVE